MHFRIQIVAVTGGGTEHFQEIADLMRSEAKIETMGLTLEESKQVLHTICKRPSSNIRLRPISNRNAPVLNAKNRGK